MTSPRSGFRRAAVASWTLAGIGVAGVAGASALAYAETYRPPVVEATAPEAVEPAVIDAPLNLPPAPPVVVPPPTADAPPPPPTPESAATEAPVQTYTPEYTPEPTYTPNYTQAPVVQQAPVQQAPVQQAPVVQQAPMQQAPNSSGSFPIRTSHVPAGGGQISGGNSFSPHVTISRGS
jgi:periplasmic protein TonB